MKNTKIFGLIPIILLLFSVLFFIYNIEDCATDEEVLLSISKNVETLENQVVEYNIPIKIVEHDNDGYFVKEDVTEDEKQQIVETENVQSEYIKGEKEEEKEIHVHNKQVVYTEPNCYKDGEEKVVCKECNFVFEKKKIDKIKHEWENICEVEATPEKDGKIIYRCKICFNGKEEKIKFDVTDKTKLYIPSLDLNIDIEFAECNQENTDKYDVCCDMNLIDKNNPLFWGHNNRTMKDLYKIKVGDIIYFVYDNKIEKYVVTISEEGYIIDDGANIMGKESKVKCISKYGNKTLHFFTCHQTIFNYNARWIVLAEKVQ